jgi:hypothetical protein
MFSKLIPRKSAGIELQVTENPLWQAQIPLFPEPDEEETGTEMVKLKLRRNPMVASSPTYEKSYTPCTNWQYVMA